LGSNIPVITTVFDLLPLTSSSLYDKHRSVSGFV